jgi:putative ABC transport system permease protein
VTMAVRTAGNPETMNKSIAATIQSLDPDLPMADVKTMDQLLEESMGGDRFSAVLFGGFALIALCLAAFGIYGVMSFAVAQRTHEIGLRMALGAGQSQVIGLILKEGMAQGFIGLLVGLAGSFGIGRVMRGMWYGIGSLDPIAFAVVAAVLLMSALLACYFPARRAAQVDPMAALRQD